MRKGTQLALGAVGVAALCWATFALAGSTTPNEDDDFVAKAGPLRYASDSRLAGTGEALAGCGPSSRRLIGGGGAVSGPPDESYLKSMAFRDHNIEPPEPNPDPDTDPDDGWAASGEGPPGAAVTGVAICRKGGAMKYIHKSFPLGKSDFATGKIGCGGGRWHVTTGGPFVGTAGGWINSSHPYDGKDRGRAPDDGWRMRVFSPVGFSVSFHVICARNVALRYKRARPVTLGTGDPQPRTRTRSPGCGRGHAIGGGGRLSGLINRGHLVASAPMDGGDAGKAPDDRWRVQAHNRGGVSTKLTAFAICWR